MNQSNKTFADIAMQSRRTTRTAYYSIHILILSCTAITMSTYASTEDVLKDNLSLTQQELELERNAVKMERVKSQLDQVNKKSEHPVDPEQFEPLETQSIDTAQPDDMDSIEAAINASQSDEHDTQAIDQDSQNDGTTFTEAVELETKNTDNSTVSTPNSNPNNDPSNDSSEQTEHADSNPPEEDASESTKPKQPTPEDLIAKVAPAYTFDAENISEFANEVNQSTWYKGMKVNPYTTIKLQILLDWNHASPGPIDNGWGMNSRKALRAFEEKNALTVDGRMDTELWNKLTEGELAERPALVSYTITEADENMRFQPTARGYEGKSKMRRLSYRNIYEMFGERFHMNVNFLRKINKGIAFKAGNTITVVNVGKHNTTEIDKVIADKRKETLYAYQGDLLVATYPTTVGSSKTPSPKGKHRIVSKFYMPYYNATSKTDPKKKWVLPPGPNNPVGTVWIALSKRSYGIHGSPRPEGISRQASAGCVRLTNWDAAELYSTIKKGATIEFKD